jgi:hypothetical protein
MHPIMLRGCDHIEAGKADARVLELNHQGLSATPALGAQGIRDGAPAIANPHIGPWRFEACDLFGGQSGLWHRPQRGRQAKLRPAGLKAHDLDRNGYKLAHRIGDSDGLAFYSGATIRYAPNRYRLIAHPSNPIP